MSRTRSGAVMQPQPVASLDKCRAQQKQKAAGKPEKLNQRAERKKVYTMKIMEIVNKKAGTKWEILKVSEDCYTAKLYEMHSGDWRFLVQDGYYTKDGIEFEFDIKIA